MVSRFAGWWETARPIGQRVGCRRPAEHRLWIGHPSCKEQGSGKNSVQQNSKRAQGRDGVDAAQYVVEELVDVRVNKEGEKQVLVKWEGYRRRTWEPYSSMKEQLPVVVAELERRLATADHMRTESDHSSSSNDSRRLFCTPTSASTTSMPGTGGCPIESLPWRFDVFREWVDCHTGDVWAEHCA